MPEGTQDKPSQTGEFKRIESEPRLEREPKRPTTVPELEIPATIGSTTGIIRVLREGEDKSSEGEEDSPL